MCMGSRKRRLNRESKHDQTNRHQFSWSNAQNQIGSLNRRVSLSGNRAQTFVIRTSCFARSTTVVKYVEFRAVYHMLRSISLLQVITTYLTYPILILRHFAISCNSLRTTVYHHSTAPRISSYHTQLGSFHSDATLIMATQLPQGEAAILEKLIKYGCLSNTTCE